MDRFQGSIHQSSFRKSSNALATDLPSAASSGSAAMTIVGERVSRKMGVLRPNEGKPSERPRYWLNRAPTSLWLVAVAKWYTPGSAGSGSEKLITKWAPLSLQ